MASQLVRRHLLSYRKGNTSFGIRTKWSYLDVVQDNHRDEVDKVAAKLSGTKPGDPAYIANYKPALKMVEEGLTEEMRIKYRADAKRWSEKAPPPSVQLRCVKLLGTLGND
jgi:hypothetical protein